MKRKRTRIMALLLGAAMLTTATGCGTQKSAESTSVENGVTNTSQETQTQEGDTGELTTITLYPESAMLQSGLTEGYIGDLLAEYANVKLDVWAYSDEKTNAILASDSLPDVMYVSKDNLDVMIESGMVLNLDDYLDQLPNLTGSELVSTAMNYIREFCSAGTGNLYAIPLNVGQKSLEYGITKNMLTINWEYYTGIGAPEFNDQWELIDVIKQMQEAYPVGEDGVANYGTYLNSGSDTDYWANITMYLKWFGYEPTELKYLLESDMVNGEYHSILEDDSKYKEGLKWYNTMYREGLLDPDSINSDRSTQKAKVDNRHAMVPSGTVQGYNGYQPIYMENQQLYQESWNSVYGDDYVLVISAKSENIDAALRFVNMLADADAYMITSLGPEGDLWYADEDGVAYLRDEVLEKYKNSETMYLSTGEEMYLWYITWILDDTSMVTSYKSPSGEYRLGRLERWEEILDIDYDTDQMNEWREISGYDFLVEEAMANDAYSLTSDLDYITNFASTPDDMMQLTVDTIKDTVVNASWKMVYAETDEEFEQIWTQMVEDCEGLGAEEVIEWRLADLENAREIRDSLSE